MLKKFQEKTGLLIHIQELTCISRIQNLVQRRLQPIYRMLAKDPLENLMNGMVYVGAEVKAGDILVGKSPPKVKLNYHLKKSYCNF